VGRLILSLTILIAGAVLAAVISVAVRQIGRWNTVLRAVCERYSGFVNPGGALRNPSLQFSYNGSLCRLKYHRRKWGHRFRLTELTLTCHGLPLKLSLRSKQYPAARLSRRGIRELSIGDQAFDANYLVLASDVQRARLLLTDGVRWQINQLARHCGDHSLDLTVASGKLTIRKPGYIRNQVYLDDFIRYGLELLDQMRLAQSSGIEFEEESQAKLIDSVVCPVCSEEIREQLVVCIRCKTPHCRDCWEYNGQCAMFACGEERFISGNSQSRSAVD